MATSKTKRQKPKTVKPPKTIGEVDNTLYEIAQRNVELKKIDAEIEEKINALREEAARRAAPIQQQIADLEAGITAFAEFNKADLFESKRTLELTFGSIGYRRSTKITVKKTTVEKLEGLELFDAIIIKKSPNKEVLKTYDDTILKQVDARRKEEEAFWYEVREEELSARTGKQAIEA
ncbi:MAG TPA: hypothetical protein ENJ29_02470 [Bacteroidetes bacterium]|nr:hypothetical protein [Bacteroidota bacterium]